MRSADPKPYHGVLETDDDSRYLVEFSTWDQQKSWSIDAQFGRSTMKQGRVTLVATFLLLITSGAIIGGIIILMLESRVLRRVRSLRQGAQQIIQSGSTDIQLLDLGQDEIFDLTSTINTMVATIGRKTAEIKDIVDHVKFGFFMMDLNGRILPGLLNHVLIYLGLMIFRVFMLWMLWGSVSITEHFSNLP